MAAPTKPAVSTVTPLDKIVVPAVAPFGIPLIWGAKKVGKTLCALNSPWQPVHVVDVERSTYDYSLHQERLIGSGVLTHKFTADYADTFEEYLAALDRIIKSDKRYGTLVVDTFGQAAQWTGEDTFNKMGEKAEKQSQLAWGKARDRLRKHILSLRAKCDFLVLTAHEREYPPMSKKFSPRCNPAVQELAAFSIRLTREANTQIPDAEILGARLPFFPPNIKGFTLMKLLQYVEQPVDWNNLTDDQKLKNEDPVTVSAAGYSEDGEMNEG